jgi:hypothetical protein
MPGDNPDDGGIVQAADRRSRPPQGEQRRVLSLRRARGASSYGYRAAMKRDAVSREGRLGAQGL